jgi:hypothetical protein
VVIELRKGHQATARRGALSDERVEASLVSDGSRPSAGPVEQEIEVGRF